jgi:hypothetical protein
MTPQRPPVEEIEARLDAVRRADPGATIHITAPMEVEQLVWHAPTDLADCIAYIKHLEATTSTNKP